VRQGRKKEDPVGEGGLNSWFTKDSENKCKFKREGWRLNTFICELEKAERVEDYDFISAPGAE